jgi:hypothetical protein
MSKGALLTPRALINVHQVVTPRYGRDLAIAGLLVIMGAHMLPSSSRPPAPYIVYQTEQTKSRWVDEVRAVQSPAPATAPQGGSSSDPSPPFPPGSASYG